MLVSGSLRLPAFNFENTSVTMLGVGTLLTAIGLITGVKAGEAVLTIGSLSLSPIAVAGLAFIIMGIAIKVFCKYSSSKKIQQTPEKIELQRQQQQQDELAKNVLKEVQDRRKACSDAALARWQSTLKNKS